MQAPKQNGFTLLETLLYIALFAIVIGGGMIATYQIIDSTNAGNNHIIMEEEANYLLRKIDWALTTPNSVSVPYTSGLIVNKDISGTPTQLTFSQTGNNLTLQRGAGSVVTLNSSSVTISNLNFTKVVASGKPDAIITTFTLTTVENGKNVTENFTTTKYLRK